VFGYTTIANMIERPDGVKIAAWFIATIIVTSLVSRVLRSTELRVQSVETDGLARRFILEAGTAPVRVIANRPDTGAARGVPAQAARSARVAPPAREGAGAVSRDSPG
jgi:hypothetical protein